MRRVSSNWPARMSAAVDTMAIRFSHRLLLAASLHARLQVPFAEISKLLSSEYHEARLAGFLLLVEEMSAALPKRRNVQPESAARRREIARFYLESGHQANNWDLVDLSAPYILVSQCLRSEGDIRSME